MAYSARVIEVMIASPSDVPQERRIARDVIAEWNTIHAKDRNTVLMPIGWETHAIPETGDRPQAIINGQLLKNADLLIAMFWTRIGSPTGVSQSGTVEEIDEHIKAGKSAMIYFSSAPVRPDSIDNDQYLALRSFKNSLKNRGLFEEYEDLSTFQKKLTRQLAQRVIEKFTDTSDASGPIPIIPPQRATPALGLHATKLLLEASKDRQGVLMNLMTMEGASVQTNGTNFAERGDPRSEALWRGAVAELAKKQLIEDRGGEGEVYFVNDEGYRVAELLQQRF